MNYRISTESEIKATVLCIIKRMALDAKRLNFNHNEDDDINNFMSTKKTTNFSTLELPHGIRVINALTCGKEQHSSEDSYYFFSESYIMFPTGEVRELEGDDILNDNQSVDQFDKETLSVEEFRELEVSRNFVKMKNNELISTVLINYSDNKELLLKELSPEELLKQLSELAIEISEKEEEVTQYIINHSDKQN